jgi:hypothetical protein
VSGSLPSQDGPDLVAAIRQHRAAVEAAGEVWMHPVDQPKANAKHDADRALWGLVEHHETQIETRRGPTDTTGLRRPSKEFRWVCSCGAAGDWLDRDFDDDARGQADRGAHAHREAWGRGAGR